MIKTKIAKNSGFCFGVRRAVDMTIKELEPQGAKNIYSIGHIIHNGDVVKELSAKGLKVVEGLKDVKSGTLIIRCHGLAGSTIDEAKKKGIKLIDTTCPYVMNSHRIVDRLLSEGYTIIVVGDRNHPEIKAICDKSNVIVVDENTNLAPLGLRAKKIGIVAQTTIPLVLYKKVMRKLLNKGFKELRIFNTICDDTRRRQLSAKSLAKSTDCVLVVGGKSSANTKRLYQICKKINPSSYYIENSDDIDRRWFKSTGSVGIASGASTPDYVIDKIVERIKV